MDNFSQLRLLDKIPKLFLIETNIYIYNLKLDIFNGLLNTDDNQKFLHFLDQVILKVIESTESTIIINVLIQDNIFNVKFKDVERIFFFFYSRASLTKFIENKNVFVRFPQLNNNFNLYEEINSNYSHEAVTILIDTENKLDNFIKSNYLIEELNMIDHNKKKFYYINADEYQHFNNQTITNSQIIKQLRTHSDQEKENSKNDLNILAYEESALGGSFDHYHIGHNMLLSTAVFLTTKKIIIGITSDLMISYKASNYLLQPFSVREANLRNYLGKIGCISEISVHMLHDGSGEAATNTCLQALILTPETLKGGLKVNEERSKNNLTELPLIEAKLISNNEEVANSSKLSSSNIRNNLLLEFPIDKFEELYNYWVKLTNTLKCPSEISQKWFSIIRDLHMQSWRKYHSLVHILTYVSLVEKYFMNGIISDYVNIALSAWFHDIIYTPSRMDNEERSVKKFYEFYEEIRSELIKQNTINLIDCIKVTKYIMATKKHFTDDVYEDDLDINYFLDFDLFTFGSSDVEYYLKINEGIKFEFTHHLSIDQFREGRRKFLSFLINKKNIFRTEEFINKYENFAKRNIQREYELL